MSASKRRRAAIGTDMAIPKKGRVPGEIPPPDPDFPRTLRMLQRSISFEMLEIRHMVTAEMPDCAPLIRGV